MTRNALKEYLTRHIAQILYDTVEHANPEERALDDWLEAEKIVGKQFNWDLGRWEFDTRGLDISFDEFTATYGLGIWHSTQPHRKNLPRPPYGCVIFK